MMNGKPVGENHHGLAVPFPDHNRLSIQLRPDGLSFAYVETKGERKGEPTTADISFPDTPQAELPTIEWPQEEFRSVWVCVPSERAALIPAEWNRPERYPILMASLGHPDNPDIHLQARPCLDTYALLHGISLQATEWLENTFGDKLSFFHPLSAGLCASDNNETILHIDTTAGYGNFALIRNDKPLSAEVFPLADEADLLLIVHRILLSNKIDTCRIVCSGERCQTYASLLKRHYGEVSVHPDAGHRNLIWALRCE